ncbi:MAG: hypothetical protein HGA37_12860 [Lentimicrobium sp.]|nr:hypothetical protein [Lentimicrobium sp.]
MVGRYHFVAVPDAFGIEALSCQVSLAAIGLGTAVAMRGTMLHDPVKSFLGAILDISLLQNEIDMNSPTIRRTIIRT